MYLLFGAEQIGDTREKNNHRHDPDNCVQHCPVRVNRTLHPGDCESNHTDLASPDNNGESATVTRLFNCSPGSDGQTYLPPPFNR